MEWIVAESSSATTKPYVTRDTAVDRGIVRITIAMQNQRVRVPPDLMELIEFFEGLKGAGDG